MKVIRGRWKLIKFNKDRQSYEPESFDPSLFTHTYHLTVEASDPSDPHLFNQTFIVELLSKITKLKTLTWNVGPISTDVLSALERFHPQCTLRIFSWWRLNGDLNQLDETEIALTRFKNLTHFRYVTVSDPSSAATLTEAYSWEPFQEIVASSHRLELASFLSSSIFRHVEAQEWIGNGASSVKAGKSSNRNKLKSLTIDCPNLTLSSSTLHEIGEFTDLSSLEYLKFSRGRAQDYFQVAASLLPNLKHVSLNFNNSNDDAMLKAAGEYLRTCTPVQTLSLWGWSSVITLPDLLSRHGSSLQDLQLHEKDTLSAESRKALQLADIKLIMGSCPQLADITIDLDIPDYDVRSHEKILRAVADKKPQLRRVQIYLGAGELLDGLLRRQKKGSYVNGTFIAAYPADHPIYQPMQRGKTDMIAYRSEYLLPIVEPCATAMWELLYGESISGERLLDLKFGDWETRSPMSHTTSEPRTFCQVKPHERDDRIGQCVVRTRHWSNFFSKGVELKQD